MFRVASLGGVGHSAVGRWPVQPDVGIFLRVKDRAGLIADRLVPEAIRG